MGKFLENNITEKDYNYEISDINIKTGEKTQFTMKGTTIGSIISTIQEHPEQTNMVGHLSELSAFKGIFACMFELLDNNTVFKKYLKKIFKDQYFDFEQILRFTRNVMVHAISPSLILKKDDFIKQRDFLYHEASTHIILHLRYADIIPQWKGSEDYGFDIIVDFDKIEEGQEYFQLISRHTVYMFTELCYNLTKIFQHIAAKQAKDKKPGKN